MKWTPTQVKNVPHLQNISCWPKEKVLYSYNELHSRTRGQARAGPEGIIVFGQATYNSHSGPLNPGVQMDAGNLWENLIECLELLCYGLASHPESVSMHRAASCYRIFTVEPYYFVLKPRDFPWIYLLPVQRELIGSTSFFLRESGF